VPQAPWDDSEICRIFQQTSRQLANLAHTTGPSQTNYDSYLRILDRLANVKVGVVLVDLGKQMEDGILDDQERPIDVLAELFQVCLQSLRVQHPNIVHDYVKGMISSCLEEYYGGLSVPIPLVDQLLICVGQGPKIWVTNPVLANGNIPIDNKKLKQQQQRNIPLRVQQSNPSHAVATSIIRNNLHGLSPPITNLLNGIINGDSRIMERSAIGAQDDEDDNKTDDEESTDIWTVLYELGMVVPGILTNVIGNIETCLASEDVKRFKAVHLLGRLFGARSSKLATKFKHCFQQWLNRSVDKEKKIRMMMCQYLVNVIKNNGDHEVVKDSESTLVFMMEGDAAVELRRSIIHSVCDYAYENAERNPPSAKLLKAVGARMKSKDSEERMNSLTGLAQIYFRHYVKPVLEDISTAGDNYDVELVAQVLTENGDAADEDIDAEQTSDDPSGERKKRYRWIPSLMFQCWCYTADHALHNRLVQLVDDLILGSDTSKKASKYLSLPARAVGLTIILRNLLEPGENILVNDSMGNGFCFMLQYFRKRQSLQNALSKYLDAKKTYQSLKSGVYELGQITAFVHYVDADRLFFRRYPARH
jgi:hypothetical protein